MKTRLALLAISATVLVTPVLAAKSSDPAGDKAMHDYVITMPKVKGYEAATVSLTAAMKTDAALKAERKKMDDEPDKTFAQLRAKILNHPHFFGYFSKQGLSADDAVLLPLTLMSACTVVQYPQIAAGMADTVSPSQVAFCKANMAQLKTMSFFNGIGHSDDSDDSDQ